MLGFLSFEKNGGIPETPNYLDSHGPALFRSFSNVYLPVFKSSSISEMVSPGGRTRACFSTI